MDFKSLLSQLDQLNEAKKAQVEEGRSDESDDDDYDAEAEAEKAEEKAEAKRKADREEGDLNEGIMDEPATKETPTGRVHKAKPGGYGRKDDEDDEGKKVKADAPKRGRGRPKKDADSSGEVKKYDWSAFGAKGKDVKLPKWDKDKTTKHSLKDWVEHIEGKYIAESEQIAIKPIGQIRQQPGQSSIGQSQQVQGQQKKNTQVIQLGDKTLGTVDNPQLAQQIKQSIGKGEMTLMPDQEMAEGEFTQHYKPEPAKKPSVLSKVAGVAKKVFDKVAPGDEQLLRDLEKSSGGKRPVGESANHRLSAARLQGKSHGLTGHSHIGKSFEDMEEARLYHEGYKEGLDECYGQDMSADMVGEAEPAIVDTMASFGAQDEVEEGNAFTAALARTPTGGQFKLGGTSFTDNSGYDASIDEMAFESWDKQLNSILTEGEKVDEGMTVSISKGQQGSPDSVSVTAQDQDADQLLAIIKQAGLGLFGGDDNVQQSDSTPMSIASDGEPAEIGAEGDDIEVVDDNEGMMALIKKMTDGSIGGSEESSDDFADETPSDSSEEATDDSSEEHAHEETCEQCGSSECECDDTEETQESAEEEVDAQQEQSEDEEEKVEESYANSEDDGYEADLNFLMKAISGGLNKEKSTGQTTNPVIAGQTQRMGVSEDSVNDWKKLAGI